MQEQQQLSLPCKGISLLGEYSGPMVHLFPLVILPASRQDPIREREIQFRSALGSVQRKGFHQFAKIRLKDDLWV